jgi:hypothetical protein
MEFTRDQVGGGICSLLAAPGARRELSPVAPQRRSRTHESIDEGTTFIARLRSFDASHESGVTTARFLRCRLRRHPLRSAPYP